MRRLVIGFGLLGCAAALSLPRERVVAEEIRPSIELGGPVEDHGEPEAPPPGLVMTAPVPPPKTCREALTLAGVTFEDASPSKIIHDPVKLAPSIAGVVFRHQNDKKPRWMWVDCRFALRLHDAARAFAARGIREVVHAGTYEPKCSNGGTPDDNPDCKPSAHAVGMAIDVVTLIREHDQFDFAKHFVKRTDHTPTCLAPRVGGEDGFLKELVCALDGTFNVILTPNWDDKHRTHAHLALHPDAGTGPGVDPDG